MAKKVIPKKADESPATHSFSLMTIIVDEGYGEELIELLQAQGVRLLLMVGGEGTAPTALKHLLSLGESHKNVLITVVKADQVAKLTKSVKEAYQSAGVLFTIKMTSLGGHNILNYLNGGVQHG